MKIKKERNSEGEKNENEIDVKRDATGDDDDEITKNNHYFKNSYRS